MIELDRIEERMLTQELEQLINRLGIDSKAGIADYVLAQYLVGALKNLTSVSEKIKDR